MMERRREPRPETDFPLRVWGVDRDGRYFSQEVQARNVSVSGALFSQLDQEPKAGDLIGVEYNGKKARFRVVWVRNSGNRQKVQAAVHRISTDECPWLDILLAEQTGDSARVNAPESRARRKDGNPVAANGLGYDRATMTSTVETGTPATAMPIAAVKLPMG
jgi:hypothetical protein